MLDQVRQGCQFAYATFQAIRSSEKVYYYWDIANFAFGFLGLYHLFQDHYFENHDVLTYPKQSWQKRASKMIDLFGNLSFVLSGMISGPALTIWNRTASVILSPTQLTRIPGNKIYYSLGALSFVLGIPTTLKTFYVIYTWMRSSPSSTRQEEEKKEVQEAPKDSRAYTSLLIKKSHMIATIKTISKTARNLQLSLS